MEPEEVNQAWFEFFAALEGTVRFLDETERVMVRFHENRTPHGEGYSYEADYESPAHAELGLRSAIAVLTEMLPESVYVIAGRGSKSVVVELPVVLMPRVVAHSAVMDEIIRIVSLSLDGDLTLCIEAYGDGSREDSASMTGRGTMIPILERFAEVFPGGTVFIAN
ncbi:MAG: hypothetical protein ACI89L_000128 [Phycisphaerales bacterium]|jgi:hypothetical protein